MDVPTLGDRIPQRGNSIVRAGARALLSLLGWRIEGSLPNLPKFVLIVAPHTSNWDFFLGVTVMFTLGLRISWMAKHTIFWWPASAILRWLGGIPVNRHSPHGVVDQIVSIFNSRDQFVLGIAPEGTRKKVERWKMGFYHIARGASVPILPVAFDYRRKTIGIGPLLIPSGDLESEVAQIQSFYVGVTGKYAHRF